MEEQNNETVNVQQPEQLTGLVNNQAQTVDNIVSEAVNQPTEKEQKYSERLALLDGLRIVTSTEVPPEEPSLSVDNVGFFALDDIHAVKAKQKQGKTTTLKICLSALLKGQMFFVQLGWHKRVYIYSNLSANKIIFCKTSNFPQNMN